MHVFSAANGQACIFIHECAAHTSRLRPFMSDVKLAEAPTLEFSVVILVQL